jgi:hypothetical protein
LENLYPKPDDAPVTKATCPERFTVKLGVSKSLMFSPIIKKF